MKNYYEILEVNKKASQETISKVYKFLAKKYHPDANIDNPENTEEKFKEISEAYEILSNQEKRKQYDIELENYELGNSAETVSMENFIELRDYCKQLENILEQYTSTNEDNDEHNYQYQNETNYSNIEYEKAREQARQYAYQDSVNRASAYHDYVNNLRSMGYKIRYKKTFKKQLENYLALVVFAVIIYIFFKVIWLIPTLKNWFLSLFIINL